MFSSLLIILYTTISVFILHRLSRNFRHQLSARQVTISFIIKILFGMAYGFIFLKFYNGDDTWKYFNASLIEYQKLLHHPIQFLSDTISGTPGKIGLESAYDTKNSFWNNIDEVLFIKMLAVFNVFSFGNYFVNVVLFCFVVYIGNLLFFRLFVRHFPEASLSLQVVILYIPVVIFWLSGIRKDGLLFLALAIVLFYFDRIIRREKIFFVNAGMFLFGFITLCLIRNLFAMCMAPSLAAWFLCSRLKIHAVISFTGVYLLACILFFASGSILGLPNLAEKVMNRQYDFFSLIANTRLPLDSLKATPSSYLHILPQALNHAFLRPYLTESKGILQVISAIDVVFFMTLMLMALVFHDKKFKSVLCNPVILTCLYTSLCGYILIGYTVPFPGAIVRYKIIFELLFLSTFAVLAHKPIKSLNNITVN